MDGPKFVTGAIVRSSFFHQYFPDDDEGQNRFTVIETIMSAKKGRVCRVKMIEKPNKVGEIREVDLDPA